MKTELNKIIILLLLIQCMTSCSDFLKEDPKGRLSSQQAFTDKNDLEGSVHALYWRVRYLNFYSNQAAPVWGGDDITSIVSKQSYLDFDQYNISDGNTTMTAGTGNWNNAWRVIKAANFIINGVANTPDITESELTFALGQAYYWRAYTYFFLVRCWGPLPLMLDETIIENQSLTSEADIYELIINDLTEAEKLPVQYTTIPWALNGRNIVVSKGAVQATLGYVYLTMAGWPLNKGAEYYSMAASKLNEVIEGVENQTYYYELFDEYWKIHSKTYNYNNQEALLSIYYSRNFGTGDGSQAGRAGISDIPEETGGYSNARAEIKFWHEFPTGPRKKATFGDVYYHNEHELIVPWFYDAVINCRNPYFIKAAFTNNDDEYDQRKSYNDQSNGWDDIAHQIIRLSEVYCWYAEAVGRSGQTSAKAIELLNRVRNRADGAATNRYSAGMSADQLAEAAYDEHGWEIAGWYWGSLGARYYNMRRMNRVKEHFEYRLRNPEINVIPQYKLENPDLSILDIQLPDQLFLNEAAVVTGTWSDDKMYVPYPASDVLLNPNLKR